MQQILQEHDTLTEFVRFNSRKWGEHLELRYNLWMAKMIARMSVCGLLLLAALINYFRFEHIGG